MVVDTLWQGNSIAFFFKWMISVTNGYLEICIFLSYRVIVEMRPHLLYFTTGSICRKTPQNNTGIPPKGVVLPRISCKVLSTASYTALCAMGASSTMIALHSLREPYLFGWSSSAYHAERWAVPWMSNARCVHQSVEWRLYRSML